MQTALGPCTKKKEINKMHITSRRGETLVWVTKQVWGECQLTWQKARPFKQPVTVRDQRQTQKQRCTSKSKAVIKFVSLHFQCIRSDLQLYSTHCFGFEARKCNFLIDSYYSHSIASSCSCKWKSSENPLYTTCQAPECWSCSVFVECVCYISFKGGNMAVWAKT